jgi:hypothetical protein
MSATAPRARVGVPRARDDDYTREAVLCGELSLGSAIVAEEWVSAHDL